MRHGQNLPASYCTGANSDYHFLQGRPPGKDDLFLGDAREDPQEREGALALLAKVAYSLANYPAASFIQAAAEDGQTDLTASNPLDNPTIPAGYTYLLQLIAHDMTFDPTALASGPLDPGRLTNLRTSLLDLDCLYGGGPASCPMLYRREGDDRGPLPRTHLRLGATRPNGRTTAGSERLVEDLPRIMIDSPDNSIATDPKFVRPPLRDEPDTPIPLHCMEALIADSRNEDNLILSQLVVLFHKLHNKIATHVSRLQDTDAQQYVFETAQMVTRQVYQEIIEHDLLTKLIDSKVLKQYEEAADPSDHPIIEDLIFRDGRPMIPVEFTVGAFRFGHAMIRDRYVFEKRYALMDGEPNDQFQRSVSISSLMRFHGEPPAPLGALKVPITDRWVIEWGGFFWEGSDQAPAPDAPLRNHSRRITPGISERLLSDLRFQPREGHRPLAPADDHTGSWGGLAYRDLARAFDIGLPTGQALARDFALTSLNKRDLRKRLDVFPISSQDKDILTEQTPLPLYVLFEAELQKSGLQLGELGSLIVGGTIISNIRVSSKKRRAVQSTLPRSITDHLSELGKLPQTMPELVSFVN